MSFDVSSEGDYAFQCVAALQYASEAEDFEPGGIEFSVEPELAVDCSDTVQQSSAASSGY